MPSKLLIKRVVFLLLWVCSSFLVSGCAAQPPEIDSYGMWTLAQLGYSDLIFPLQEDVEKISIEFRLPKNASQGPETWYVLHLNFRIELSEECEGGIYYVGADTNNYACALIQFKPQIVDDSLVIVSTTTGLIDKGVHTTPSLSIDYSFRNYLRTMGTKPGLNVLTFKLEQWGPKLRSLRIFDNSGIECTPLSPSEYEG